MKSFLQGKKCLDISPLRPPAGFAAPNSPARGNSSPASGAQPGGNAHSHAPGASNASVEVVKEGDKVIRLVITCVCGERVEVECIYPAG
jgi:hypothetical protein